MDRFWHSIQKNLSIVTYVFKNSILKLHPLTISGSKHSTAVITCPATTSVGQGRCNPSGRRASSMTFKLPSLENPSKSQAVCNSFLRMGPSPSAFPIRQDVKIREINRKYTLLAVFDTNACCVSTQAYSQSRRIKRRLSYL